VRGLIAIAAAAALVAGGAAAMIAAVPLRIATRADLAPRLTDPYEYWIVRAFDPASRRMVEVRFSYE